MDITNKYIHMIESFENDFVLAKTKPYIYSLSNINLDNERVVKDISLLIELSYLLRHEKAKIISCED